MEEEEHAGWHWLLSSAAICGLATLAGIWLERTSAAPEVATGLYAVAYLAGGWEAAIETLMAAFPRMGETHAAA